MKKLITLGAFLTPLVSFAAITNIGDLGFTLIAIINDVLVPLVFAIAFIVFIWGVFSYFIAGKQDEKAQEKGRNLMLYGLIGFFVMVSVWGVINLLVGTFELNTQIPDLPEVPVR